jgi:hypothetical protein
VQVAFDPLPVSVHVPVNVPLPLLVKVTVPVGVVGAVALVSVTVAVQLVELSAMIIVGWHVTCEVVVCPPLFTAASSFVVRYEPSAPPTTYIRLL